ncbi:MAG: hypothetical protein ACFFFB_05010, partial [Candidatus Heimdallarchaeota archaeon]
TFNAQDVYVEGNYAYIADSIGRLKIINISDPNIPSLAGECLIPAEAYGVIVLGKMAFVADGRHGLKIIDVSNPSQTTLVGQCGTSGFAYGIYISGNIAYIAGGAAGLQVFDISDLANPRWIGECDLGGIAQDIQVVGNVIFVVCESEGLKIVNVEDPTTPTIIGNSNDPTSAFSVVIKDQYAYVADGDNGLQIIDISDLTNPQFVAKCDTWGKAYDVAIRDNYIYLVGYPGMQIIDVRDPAKPDPIKKFSTSQTCLGIFLEGEYAYLASSTSGLSIVDIADQLKPSIIGSFEGEIRNYCNIFIEGDFAYITDNRSTDEANLQIFNISNPLNPIEKGKCTLNLTPWGSRRYRLNLNDVYIKDNYAYVVRSGGFDVVDISDPENPRRVTRRSIPNFPRKIDINGNFAYIVGGGFLSFSGEQLSIFNIQNPNNPFLVKTISFKDPPYADPMLYDIVVRGDYVYLTSSHGLYIVRIKNGPIGEVGSLYVPSFYISVLGDYAYITGYHLFLYIIDISVPSNPKRLRSYEIFKDYPRNIHIAGNSAYIVDETNGLSLVDIKDPLNADLLSTTPCTAKDAYIKGNHAFLACGYDGLQIVNVGEYTKPKLASFSSTYNFAEKIFIAGNSAYIADRDSGLQIYDVKNPRRPLFSGNINTNGSAYDVFVSGKYAYIADGSNGLQIANISNPTNIPPLTGCPLNGFAYGVFVDGNHAFIAAGNQGLQVIDIKNPMTPNQIAECAISGIAYGIFVAGNYAFIASGERGMQIIDITDPRQPRRINGCITTGIAYDVFISGNHAYLACGFEGLKIINIEDLNNLQIIGNFYLGRTVEYPSGQNDPLIIESSARAIFVEGDFAYVANEDKGLLVISIDDKENPFLVASYNTPGLAHGVHIEGDFAYIADGFSGLQIIETGRAKVRKFMSPGLAQSLPLSDINHTVYSATLNTLEKVPTDTSINYFLSANKGQFWAPVELGTQYNFRGTQRGDQLLWKAEMITSNPFKTPIIARLTIDYQVGNTRPTADPTIFYGEDLTQEIDGAELKHLDVGLAQIGPGVFEVPFFTLSSHSNDDDDDELTYLWTIATKPLNSQVALDNSFASSTLVTNLDLSGYYLIQLIVNDGFENSEPTFIGIHVFEQDVRYPLNSIIDSFDTNIVLGIDVVVTLMEIINPGITSTSASNNAPQPPTGGSFYLNTQPEIYYDISTTTEYDGDVIVCVKYDAAGLSIQEQENLKLFHWEEIALGPPPEWEYVDVTIQVDTNNKLICGRIKKVNKI